MNGDGLEHGGGVTGTWKLISARVDFPKTGEHADLFGPDPRGFLIMSAGGRMMALLTSGDRSTAATISDPAALLQSMMAYSGRYRLEGDRFITDVDLAWHPSWEGTSQDRFFACEGDRLFIRTGESTHPKFPGRLGRAELAWVREA
jgi:hypothetical protein